MRIDKKQILNETNLKISYYVKPPYSILKKKPKKEMEVSQFKKFMQMLTNIHVSVPLCEALKKMSVYT